MRYQFNQKMRRNALAVIKRQSALSNLFLSLVWLWLISAMFAAKPAESDAAKQRPLRKEAPTPAAKAKARPAAPSAVASPIKRLTKVQARSALLRQPVLPPIDLSDRREHIQYNTQGGETLIDVLGRYNLHSTERLFWNRSIQQNLGNQRMPAGREINLFFAPQTTRANQRQLKALEVDFNESATLTWERGIRGVLFQRREKPFDVELKTASAVVNTSLMEDGKKAGIHPTLLSQLTDIFTWDLDLEKEIQRGDSFKILYEKRSRKGQDAKASLRIVAAELINAGQKLTAIYFEKNKGQGNYYNLEGRSLARSFLRFPLEFANISSYFSDNRFNPLLRVNMAHTGVDFAAARGTPVRAVGDGVIAEAGWNGGYGKTLDLKHDSTYMSRYAHLDSFAEGIGVGTPVKKGQVIGFVGSTGRSTGPHLHFELYKDNQYVDPLGVHFPAEEQIEPGLRKIFDTQLKTYLVELSSTSAPRS